MLIEALMRFVVSSGLRNECDGRGEIGKLDARVEER